jgi:hypothetical protein
MTLPLLFPVRVKTIWNHWPAFEPETVVDRYFYTGDDTYQRVPVGSTSNDQELAFP